MFLINNVYDTGHLTLVRISSLSHSKAIFESFRSHLSPYRWLQNNSYLTAKQLVSDVGTTASMLARPTTNWEAMPNVWLSLWRIQPIWLSAWSISRWLNFKEGTFRLNVGTASTGSTKSVSMNNQTWLTRLGIQDSSTTMYLKSPMKVVALLSGNY